MINTKVNPLDLAERVGWTFIQAVAGSVTAAGTAASLQTFDWRAALAGGGTAALICLLKVLGVSMSALLNPTAPPVAPPVPVPVSAPDPEPEPEPEPVTASRHQLLEPDDTDLGLAPISGLTPLQQLLQPPPAVAPARSAAAAAALSATPGSP